MAIGQPNGVIQCLRRAVLLRDGAGLTDGQLLADYINRRDQAALAALVQRHAPMVWGVCRRILGNHHDAEDAFQATFLVLVRKAASIATPRLLANWLYGVAHQTALKARATVAKRKYRERQVAEMPEPAIRSQGAGVRSQWAGVSGQEWNELQPLLDQELSRLPGIHRVVIVLCDLEGKTRKEAARHLGLPEGTVASRLTRARECLAKRLRERGVAMSAGALAALLAQNAASAGVPSLVVSNAIQAASLFAAGPVAAAGPVSAKVAALADGVLKAMIISKLKAAGAVVLLLSLIITGATVLSFRPTPARGDQGAQPPAAEGGPALASQKKAQRSAAVDTELDRLQGEWTVVAIEEDGNQHTADEVKGMKWVINGNEITGTNPDGSTGKMSFRLDARKSPKEIEVTSLDRSSKGKTSAGIYTLDNGRLRVCLGEKVRPKDFTTAPGSGNGTITLEQQPFTVWGDEVGGLQAGLGFLPGQKRAYTPGETVKLVVRVRNVGKKAVEFQYLNQFFRENPPTVTDGEGKPVLFERVTVYGIHAPVEVDLAPGKEIELYELQLDARSGAQSVRAGAWTLHGTGKFSIRYERILGNSSSGLIKVDPALRTLGTGKLELDIQFNPPARATEKESPQRQQKTPKEEAFTAWGKEVGGLQAGLGFHPGQKRAYRHGETVKLAVRVRNVGKEAVEFQYLRHFFLENPPVVTDEAGKPVRLKDGAARGIYKPVDVNLAPGKEIELYELKLELGDLGNNLGVGVPKDSTLYGTGKFSIQYERILGNSLLSSVSIKFDPILNKLATGKLELEVHPKMPAGWGGGGTDYELSIDRTVKHLGQASGSIKSIAAQPTWYGAFTQAIKGDDFRGRRLRLTAYVKAKDVDNSAGLWMRIESIDGKGNYSISSDFMGERSIKGTSDWKQQEIVLDVPNEGSTAIYFGALLVGKGQMWVDDFKLEIVDQTVKTTGRIQERGKSSGGLAKGLPKEPKNLDFEQ